MKYKKRVEDKVEVYGKIINLKQKFIDLKQKFIEPCNANGVFNAGVYFICGILSS